MSTITAPWSRRRRRVGAAAGAPHDDCIDLDIQGIVRVRLIRPAEHHARALARQLGATETTAPGHPDITVRYVDEFATPALTYVGSNAGFTPEGFYLLAGSAGRILARIPFERIGRHCELLCRRQTDSVPLLPDIVRFAFLKKDYVPLHASAFIYDGTGVLIVAWARGGKTGATLSFVNHGAQFVGDEWIMVAGDGREMLGMRFPIELSEWQVEQIRNSGARLGIQQRIAFAGVRALAAIQERLDSGIWRKSFALELLRRGVPLLRRQLTVNLDPETVFSKGSCALKAPLDRVLLVMSHADSTIELEPCDPAELVHRMCTVSEYEQRTFFGYYQAFKFAFPHLRNEFLETAHHLQASILSHALLTKQAYRARHPYPIELESLFQGLRPICERAETAR